MTDNIGVYKIYFKEIEDKVYIGASSNLKKRFSDHMCSLNRGNHCNIHLQEGVTKGLKPVFEIIEYTTLEDLFIKELYYIAQYNSYYSGFNMTFSKSGGIPGELNGMAKYTESQYIEVLHLLANTSLPFSEVEKLTGVSIYVIKHISRGSAHSYLKDMYPIEYNKVMGKVNTRSNSAAYKGIVYPIIVSPEGNEYNIENVTQFAKEHKLQTPNLHKVLIGKRKSHLGWKLK